MNDKLVHILVKNVISIQCTVYTLFGSIGKMKSSIVKGKIKFPTLLYICV